MLPDFSHRDRRAHREVNRAFWAVVGASLALTGVALWVPLPFAGIAAVVAMGFLGLGCVVWAERVLEEYTRDLLFARDEQLPRGFARAETATPVGLYRDGEQPWSPSPHSRRRPGDAWTSDRTSDPESEPPTGQL